QAACIVAGLGAEADDFRVGKQSVSIGFEWQGFAPVGRVQVLINGLIVFGIQREAAVAAVKRVLFARRLKPKCTDRYDDKAGRGGQPDFQRASRWTGGAGSQCPNAKG